MRRMRLGLVLLLGALALPTEPLEPDNDHDGIPNVEDNCPTRKNPDQKDTNNNGKGDACDCYDGIKGPNEEGKDCGGICTKQCYQCIPLLKRGSSADKIDIVFVPDEDYYGNYAQFVQDANKSINSGYFGNPDISSNKCKWNFWYVQKDGDYRGTCKAWDLPLSFNKVCPFADGVVILFKGGDRACSSAIFSSPAGSPGVIVHETGHKIFGLADEYCCDGGYGQAPTFPNVYTSRTTCQSISTTPGNCNNFCPETKCWPGKTQACLNWASMAGQPDSECDCASWATANGMDKSLCKPVGAATCATRWTDLWQNRGVNSALTTISPHWCPWRGVDVRACCVDGGDGFWKSEPSTDTMWSGNAFGPDCKRRIKDKFDDLPVCTTGGSVGSIIASFPKSLVVHGVFGIDGLGVQVNEISFAYSDAPNSILDVGEFQWTLSSAREKLSRDMDDPREFHSRYEPDEATTEPPKLAQTATLARVGRAVPTRARVPTAKSRLRTAPVPTAVNRGRLLLQAPSPRSTIPRPAPTGKTTTPPRTPTPRATAKGPLTIGTAPTVKRTMGKITRAKAPTPRATIRAGTIASAAPPERGAAAIASAAPPERGAEEDHVFRFSPTVPFVQVMPWVEATDPTLTLREKASGRTLATVGRQEIMDALMEFCEAFRKPEDTECSKLVGAQARSGQCCLLDKANTGTVNCASMDAQPARCGATNGACFWDVTVPKCCELAQAADPKQECDGGASPDPRCTRHSVGAQGRCQSREALITQARAQCRQGETLEMSTLIFVGPGCELGFAILNFECCGGALETRPCTSDTACPSNACVNGFCEFARVQCGNDRDCPEHTPYCSKGYCTRTKPTTQCEGFNYWGCRTAKEWDAIAQEQCGSRQVGSILPSDPCKPNAAGVPQFAQARWECCTATTVAAARTSISAPALKRSPG